MKAKHITGGKVEILLVEGLPKNTKDLCVWFTDEPRIVLIYDDFNEGEGIMQYGMSLPQSSIGNWQFLSTIENLTGSEADILVRKVPLGYWLDYVNPHKRYDYMCSTPKESFLSLLQSNGVLFENPLGDYSEAHKRHIVTGTWDAVQSSVFNPKTTLIFTKKNIK